MTINHLTGHVVDAALRVHSALGPGLLENVYEMCLAYELRDRGLEVSQQVELPVIYRGVRIDIGYRIDLLVGKAVVVEVKTVRKLSPIHQAQLLSYLKLSNCRVGLLLNFHVARLADGIMRMANRA